MYDPRDFKLSTKNIFYQLNIILIMKVFIGKLYSSENNFKLFVCNVPICVSRSAVDTYAFYIYWTFVEIV